MTNETTPVATTVAVTIPAGVSQEGLMASAEHLYTKLTADVEALIQHLQKVLVEGPINFFEHSRLLGEIHGTHTLIEHAKAATVAIAVPPHPVPQPAAPPSSAIGIVSGGQLSTAPAPGEQLTN